MTIIFEKQLFTILAPLISDAKTEILACCYEWAWYDHQQSGTAQDINRAICSASRRKVHVEIMLHYDSPRSHLAKVNSKSASRLRKHGAFVYFGNTRKVIHAKFWIFDAHTAIICTHNMSSRAMTSNAEIGVLITDPGEVAQIRDYFFRLRGVPAPAPANHHPATSPATG